METIPDGGVPQVSERGAERLFALLLERGYFHDPVAELRHSSSECFQETDADCSILRTACDRSTNESSHCAETTSDSSQYAVSVRHLQQKFLAWLELQSQVVSIPNATLNFGISEQQIKDRIIRPLQQEQGDEDTEIICLSESVVTTRSFLNHLVSVRLLQALNEPSDDGVARGRRCILDVAGNVFGVSPEMAWNILRVIHPSDRPDNIFLLSTASAKLEWPEVTPASGAILSESLKSRIAVTGSYLIEYADSVCGAFAILHEPVLLSEFARSQGWAEVEWVKDILSASQGGEIDRGMGSDYISSGVLQRERYGLVPLRGTLTLGNTLYVPHSFRQRYLQWARDRLVTNGYLTKEECSANGIATSALGVTPTTLDILGNYPESVASFEAIKEHLRGELPASATEETNVIVLSNSVIFRPVVVTPMITIVQEVISSNRWMELTDYVPGPLSEFPEDITTLFQTQVLSSAAAYAKNKYENSTSDSGTENSSAAGATLKLHKGRVVLFSAGFGSAVSLKVVPGLVESYAAVRSKAILLEVDLASIGALLVHGDSTLQDRPNISKHQSLVLGEIQFGVFHVDELMDAVLQFDKSLSSLSSAILNEWLVNDLVPLIDIENECRRATIVKLRSLYHEKAATGTGFIAGALPPGEYSAEAIEVAFEDALCFPTACYVLQLQSKFLKHAVESQLDENDIQALNTDMLAGFGAEFTSRLTQYALFRNLADANSLHFSTVNGGAPVAYFQPVNISCQRYPRICLSGNPPSVNPLRKLEQLLPSGVGPLVARQWALCGRECYAAGAQIVSEEEPNENVLDRVTAFIAHVEESSLTICGLPFKRLDKKSEKATLSRRRAELVQLLALSTDMDLVIDVSIILCYQVVKNLFVSGPSSILRGPVLRLLSQERKMSVDVLTALDSLIECARSGDLEEARLVRVNGVRRLVLERESSKK
jgi:hypothetical protein